MKTVGKNPHYFLSLTNPQDQKTSQKNNSFCQVFKVEKGKFANPENDTPEIFIKGSFENAERQIQP